MDVDELFASVFLLLWQKGFKPGRLRHQPDPITASDFALTSIRGNRDFASVSFFDSHVKVRKYEKHGSNYTRVSAITNYEYANPEFPDNLVKYLELFHE